MHMFANVNVRRFILNERQRVSPRQNLAIKSAIVHTHYMYLFNEHRILVMQTCLHPMHCLYYVQFSYNVI